MGRRRKPGDGTLRLRKDGRWEGRVVIDYDDNGKPKRKALHQNQKPSVRKSSKLSSKSAV